MTESRSELKSTVPIKAQKKVKKKTKKVKISISEKKAVARVTALQHKLQSIEDSKQQSLQEIQSWKEREMAIIRNEYSKGLEESASVQRESEMLDEKVERAKTIVRHLQRENKKLREKNQALRRAIDKMVQENNVLAAESSQYSEHASSLTTNMKQMRDQKTFLEDVLRQVKEHVEKFEEAIELRDDAVFCENQVGRLYLNSMREITLVVEEKADSEALIEEIDECFMRAHKGTGLEETEREMSESCF